MWKYIKRYWAGTVLVLVVIVIGYGISRSSSFQTCIAHHKQYAVYQEHQEGGPLAFKWVWRNAKVLVRCAADFTDANHGPLTALGTILLAIFTTTLWWATRTLVRHAPQIERAYISAGGLRRFVAQPTNVAGQYVLTDTRQFEFHVNNYGKTKGTVFQLGWGFCESTSVPNIEPVYQTKYFRSDINPGASGVLFEKINIPQNLIDPAVYGRVFYETIFGDRFSSGFLYRIPPRPGDSESIAPPNPRYTDERKET
jgi:hypothetical protein